MTDDEILAIAFKVWRVGTDKGAVVYVGDKKSMIAFARAIAAAVQERCIRAVDDAGGDNTQYHIDAIRARSVSGSQSGMCQCGSNLPPYAPCICGGSTSPRSET